MASQTERVIFGKQADIAVTDIVTTANDGYFVKVPNAGASGFSHVGFSLYSSGLTADGADSVLWMQGWALDHNMDFAVDTIDATPGAIHISKGFRVNTTDGGAGFEYVTSGGAGAITVNAVTICITHASAANWLCLAPGVALMLKANTGVNSWTAGTLSVRPFGFK